MIASLQNPLVKQMRKLHSAKQRSQQGVFLLEGTHLLEEAYAAKYPLECVCCTSQWQENHQQLWQQISQSGARIEIVTPEVLQAIATTINPDGVVATATRQQGREVPHTGISLALETLQDPGNLGTIIRTAAAAGASGLWLSRDSVDLDNPKVLRASAGQWFRLPMVVSQDLRQTVLQCQAAGMQAIATLPTAKMTYWEVDWQRPSVILLGNEGAGLSADLTAMTDLQVQIPLCAGVESLNVGIAAALLLYEAQRQRSQQQVESI
ncbi:MAG: 23S rRNA (guanosine-2'-O-)-methyltransferase RlmB [Chroococcidiopsis cubana SAG 39.79]|jgi:RNA methyltransferase, TrmH family|uniref:tRNA/rRNA methyltransferase n=1 Tax=Chroococcidiopsis cubana SAG 39.79 TaxID=388085 RepID=A0AB37UC22_9CYAN|nr:MULTISPECIES: RNA methyltransferase [Chroococcidiopsis]MDZ4876478.1 23S rRNA (guanosine-2'-O-)-methyltransferase RlmB [Chroococcidiopsis cubana SAG 39.79]PSB62107.1 rRNA methyltransferase [Chroococcidiopsis cubana CCALA 043]RUT05354.1 tRNA/rRNA methyltransferase [Chroococcidiopsis cubana SAG 39.79]URD49712.1 RNA methyltransferase [Chroococcidiopsis sp. CCNUC1]